MKITYLGHSGFLLEAEGLRLVTDPYLREYPFPTLSPEEIRADYILISHGHYDHVGDAQELARLSGGTIVANTELANYLAAPGVKTHTMHLGGAHTFPGVTIKLTQALHGSSIGKNPAQYLGNPAGFLIRLGGLTVYHAGDTGLFGDMELLGRLNSIDVALLPIGDNFTMGPEDALEAVRMLCPRLVIPMHYNTWPVIAQDAAAFQQAVEHQTTARVTVLQPGESTRVND
ncbi:MAG TPA: metal-dependent hydrolase [Bacillota bacterium]|nr:metal-dependent hydrolase [Bacillota bacterium]